MKTKTAKAAIEPDRAALEVAHRMLRATRPLDEMLQHKQLATVVKSVARRHMKRRAQFDVKRMQSGDID